jgi:hypothetical protein
MILLAGFEFDGVEGSVPYNFKKLIIHALATFIFIKIHEI